MKTLTKQMLKVNTVLGIYTEKQHSQVTTKQNVLGKGQVTQNDL